MKTKLHYVFSIAIFLFVFSGFSQNNYFTKVETTSKSSISAKATINEVRVYEFNYSALNRALMNVSGKKEDSKASEMVLSLPKLDGTFENYRVTEASVMHPDLQAKYPEIRSYIGYGIDSPEVYLRFSLSPYKGLSAIFLGKNETMLFEPNPNKTNQITVLKKSSILENNNFLCNTLNTLKKQTKKSSESFKDADDSQKRIYKLALSVTGEYATFHGGTLPSVNAAMVATLNNINAVFENDFNVSMQLIANNNNIVYLNPSTDPYTSLSNYNSQLASTLDTVILETNYDIGHLIGGINDGDGNATGDAGCIGCVCNNGGSVGSNNHKGSGFSTGSVPSGINFDLNYVGHEIGHQFGGNHTWTHGGNEGEDVQMEPGSGTTIMGYAGITGSTNVQLNSDAYFHAVSIQQITTFVKSTSCATIVNTGNTTPTANAGSDLTLPVGTAFKLIGTGSDANGDTITYCWEQMNEDNAATTYPNPNSTNSNSVLFRSYPPTTNATRFFPNLQDLKFGVNATQWEKIPNVNRTADFRLTVRDNRPGGANNKSDDMKVTFSNAFGPFTVTSQNTAGIQWTSGTNQTITWTVNNTNNLPGAANVNILLSTDGGATYTPIVNNVPNNGSRTITVPNTPAPYCRIMIEPTNNNFFAINSRDFSINYSVTKTCTQYSSASNLGIGITDNGGAFTQSHIINVPANTIISDVNIGVNISHSYIGDLAVAVLSPNNTQVLLKSGKDCSNETNLVGTFDDQAITFNCLNSASNFASKSINDLLSVFNGQNSSGNWTIRLGDFESGDVGTLNSWFVEVCQTIETPLSVDSFELNNLKIFPNPNKGSFTLQLNNMASNNLQVEVYDLRGRRIYKNNFEGNDNFNETIKLNNVQSGMYILNVTDGTRTATKKIIVE